MAAEYVVTIVKTTRYMCTVTADGPGEAASIVGDRVREDYLDGVAVDELGLTDLTVHRVDHNAAAIKTGVTR